MAIGNNVNKSIYFPGLNGIRAIAAFAVLISHITLNLGEFGLNNKLFGVDNEGHAKGMSLGGYGVTIFFTLSGFLITYLLLQEKEVGKINIRQFYIRRLLRIWPLYYLYFAVAIVALVAFSITFPISSLLFYILLAANIPFILGTSLPLLEHYWSIGVEEQFYLFFPRLAQLENGKLLKISIILIFILLCVKFIFWALMKVYDLDYLYLAANVLRFQSMLLGAVAAIFYYNKNRIFIFISGHVIAQLLSWLCIVLMAVNKFHIASFIDGELASVIAVVLIIGQITSKFTLINLENGICNFLGKISYGIYIIHPIVIFAFSKLLGRFSSNAVLFYMLVYLSVVIVTIALAYLSYNFYEKKFLKIKASFEIVKTRVNS